jgi:acyl carrier protein
MNVTPRVLAVVSRSLRVPLETVNLNLMVGDVAAWDSLGHATLLQAMEAEFGVTFDIDEALGIESVNDFVITLSKRLGLDGDHHAG